MAVKVIILRRIPQDVETQVHPLLQQLHQLAKATTGYITGEALINHTDPEEHLVISSWENVLGWEEFLNQEQTSNLHSQIDSYLGTDTMYQVYAAS